ncbi:hypothetical protein QJQ45_004588 [Haematococcus lacustris]|nr:hypothetical protein QJQ45_004588 [Haematococcus lacustris]
MAPQEFVREVNQSGRSTAIFRTSGALPADRALEHPPIATRIRAGLAAAFLPHGWPHSCSADYLPFNVWDTVQALSSYVRGLLTSQAVLRGVGVGRQAATPLAAVTLFFTRDVAGMMGGILFAIWQGSSFDSCAKQWRLFADVLNDMGMALELASPFFPSAFLVMACTASIARSVTGVVGGATRAALTQHFALRGNAADVSAKETSQETATTLVGMALGMVFTRATADNASACWTLFVLLTAVHIWANLRAMRCLVLSGLNMPRAELLLRHYLEAHPVRCARITAQRVVELAREAGAEGRPYVIVPAPAACYVAFHREATAGDRLQAYLQVCLMRHSLAAAGSRSSLTLKAVEEAAAAAAVWCKQQYPEFLQRCAAAGWSTERGLLSQVPATFLDYPLGDGGKRGKAS